MQFIFVRLKRTLFFSFSFFFLGIYKSVCLPRSQTIGTVWNNDPNLLIQKQKTHFLSNRLWGTHFTFYHGPCRQAAIVISNNGQEQTCLQSSASEVEQSRFLDITGFYLRGNSSPSKLYFDLCMCCIYLSIYQQHSQKYN